MVQPLVTRPLVACAISDRGARDLVWAALAAEGAEPRAIRPTRLATGHPVLEDSTALVYDLEPISSASIDLIATLRGRHPWLAILLYPPLREGVIPLLLAAGTVQGVAAKGQCQDSREPARLREFIRATLRNAPAGRLSAIVSLLLEGAPSRLLAFAQVALTRVGARTPTHARTVAAIAAELGLTPRTLQRAIPAHGLPQPKELLDWLTLLFITDVAGWSGVSLRNVARTFQVDPNTFYRLRRRLMPHAPGPARGHDVHEFDLILLAFAERCRVSRQHTAAILRRAHA